MKVAEVRLIRRGYQVQMLPYPYTKPTDYYPDLRVQVSPGQAAGLGRVSFLKLTSDSGLSSVVEVSEDVAEAIMRLSSHVLGKEVDSTEGLLDRLFRLTLPYGRKGITAMALSALDLALWDLKGKEVGKPVHRLLGGPAIDVVPAYASHLHPTEKVQELQEEALSYLEEGYRAMKMRLCCGPADGPSGLERNEALIRAVRDAIGYGVELMVDVWMAWNLKYALRALRRFQRYEIAWIEEPLPPDELEGYRELCKGVEVPVAAGEHAYFVHEFQQLIESGVRVLQPDALWSGGITTLKKVQALAEAQSASVIPHTSNPYNLHFLFSCPPHTCPMAEFLTRYRWMEEFVLNPPRPRRGEFRVEDLGSPGFGIQYDRGLDGVTGT